MNKKIYSKEALEKIKKDYPFIQDFLENNRIIIKSYKSSFEEAIVNINIENLGFPKEELVDAFNTYIDEMKDFLSIDDGLKKLSIIPGTNKSGEKEGFTRLDIYPSEMLGIVGPTGSGKSRLLADIEWRANKNTPTNRQILINDEPILDPFSDNRSLVACLSQNMNFVMDLSVDEFLQIHAESKFVADIDTMKNRILDEANKLAGEGFNKDTPITALSGGQSRALMIADVAILSSSPIVLIDEIENAGIDRKKALDLLVSSDKIILIATHDPYLALSCNKRIIINNGGIDKIIQTSNEEKNILKELDKMDKLIMNTRERLRYGEEIKSLI